MIRRARVRPSVAQKAPRTAVWWPAYLTKGVIQGGYQFSLRLQERFAVPEWLFHGLSEVESLKGINNLLTRHQDELRAHASKGTEHSPAWCAWPCSRGSTCHQSTRPVITASQHCCRMYP